MSSEFNFKRTAEAIEWRRGIVLSRLAMGHSQADIAKELQLHPSTISLDVQFLKERAREGVRDFIEKLPLMIMKSTTALNLISAETWKLVNSASDIKDKIHALALLKDVERQKVELFNNANIVDALVGAAEQQSPSVKDFTLDKVTTVEEQDQEARNHTSEEETGEESANTNDE